MKSYKIGSKDMKRKIRLESKAFYGKEVHVVRSQSNMLRKNALATMRCNEKLQDYTNYMC